MGLITSRTRTRIYEYRSLLDALFEKTKNEERTKNRDANARKHEEERERRFVANRSIRVFHRFEKMGDEREEREEKKKKGGGKGASFHSHEALGVV